MGVDKDYATYSRFATAVVGTKARRPGLPKAFVRGYQQSGRHTSASQRPIPPMRSESCVIRIYPSDYLAEKVYLDAADVDRIASASHQQQQHQHSTARMIRRQRTSLLRNDCQVTAATSGMQQQHQRHKSHRSPIDDITMIEWNQYGGGGGSHVNYEAPHPATPRRQLMRARTAQPRDRRSKSQPQQFRNNNIDPVLADATERYSMDSNDSGIRSSTHSTASSAGASSLISNGGTDDQMLIVEAVWDHVAMLADELPFAQGDVITVLDSTSNSGLWYGMCRDRTGWFPASYVRMRADESVRPSPVNNLCDDEFPAAVRYQRRKVVEELMGTERDYVKLLNDLVHGFQEQCRRRAEMFNNERISRIFGNITAICNLHSKLLKELEAAFDHEFPEMSTVANAFLRNSRNFGIYSEYCNNRPISCAELASIEKQPQYRHFFEACRLLRGMSKLSLEGFLLTPVQRICRYPLQLFELLKATPENHVDRIPLEQAHRTMRAVAAHINDAKRRVDAIQKIILWQRNVHGFRGPDIVENNHRTLISGELHCRALMKRSVQWSKTVHVYLFDQSIVLCKKDVLKKNSLVFKERMSLQTATIVDLNDGREAITGASLKNAFKLAGPVREYIFTCPDSLTKGLWLDSLRNRPRPMPPTNAEKRLAFVMLPQS